jgi:hypothetical protein
MKAEKKPNPFKLARRTANEAQHAANVSRVAHLFIEDETTERTVTRRDSSGKTYEVTVTKRKRPSKLLRKWDRAHQISDLK